MLGKIIAILLGVYLFGTLIEGLSFIKNIGFYMSILVFIIYVYNNGKGNIKEYYIKNKIVFFSFIIFLFIIFLSSIFSYSSLEYSLREYRIEFLNILIFLGISLFVEDKKYLLNVFIVSIISAFVYNLLHFGYLYYLINPHFDISIRFSRQSCDYFEFIYPFILSLFILMKNRLRYLLGIFILILIFEMLLSGTRGTWVSIIVETGIFITILVYINRKYLKSVFLFVFILLVFITSIGYYTYSKSSLFHSKVNQGLNTSGRDLIISTRLPIFLKYNDIFLGLGGAGNYNYNKFLNDNNAPKVVGQQLEDSFQYWGDEPLLLHIFYVNGSIGVLSFMLISTVILWKLIFIIKNNNISFNYRVYASSIFTSFVGYYIIRGLVEWKSFRYVVIYLLFLLIVEEVSRENSIPVS